MPIKHVINDHRPLLRRPFPIPFRPLTCPRTCSRHACSHVRRALAFACSPKLAASFLCDSLDSHARTALPFARSPLCLASSPPSPRNDDASRHRNDANDTNDRTRLQTTTHDYSRLRYDTKTTSIRYKTAGDDQQWRFPLHSRMLRSPSPKHRNSVLMPLRIRAPSTAHRLVHYIRESHTSLTHTHVHVHVRSFK